MLIIARTTGNNNKIIKRQFIRRSDMARVTTWAPTTVWGVQTVVMNGNSYS